MFRYPIFTEQGVTENGSCAPPIKIQNRAVCGLSDFLFSRGETHLDKTTKK